jgi:hypothetical protein
MTVEGGGLLPISRIKCVSWHTIAFWQHLACKTASMFKDHKLKGVELIELELVMWDELIIYFSGENYGQNTSIIGVPL